MVKLAWPGLSFARVGPASSFLRLVYLFFAYWINQFLVDSFVPRRF